MRLFLISLVPVLFALSCGREDVTSDSRPVVGFAINTLNNPFFVDMKTAAESSAVRENVRCLVQATEREMDVERQIQIVENFLQRGISILCITPNGTEAVIPAILRANGRNVPVVVVDSKVDARALQQAGAHIASFVGSDNVEGGRRAGEYIGDRVGAGGRIAILEGPPGHETGESRMRGFREAAESKGLEVVSSQVAHFDRSLGFQVFQNVLEANRELQAVFACNDLMALGAVEAISAAGRGGSIIVVGFDAIEEARDLIRDGKMAASIAQYPADMGEVAVATAARIIRGEEVESQIPTRIELITRENIDDTN